MSRILPTERERFIESLVGAMAIIALIWIVCAAIAYVAGTELSEEIRKIPPLYYGEVD